MSEENRIQGYLSYSYRLSNGSHGTGNQSIWMGNRVMSEGMTEDSLDRLMDHIKRDLEKKYLCRVLMLFPMGFVPVEKKKVKGKANLAFA